MVSVTGPIISSMEVFPPGLTVFMGAEMGEGLDLYFATASMFDKTWVGKTLTVTGKIIANSYGTPQLNVTDVSQITAVK